MALYTTGQLGWSFDSNNIPEVVVNAAVFAANALEGGGEAVLKIKVHSYPNQWPQVEFIGDHDDVFAVLYLYWTQGGETDVAFIAEQVQPVSL